MVSKEEYEMRIQEEKAIMQKNPELLQIILSKERTIESKLRTSNGLIQTSIALIALGLGAIKVFADEFIYQLFGYLCLTIALVLVLFALKRYAHYNYESKKIQSHRADLKRVIDTDGSVD